MRYNSNIFLDVEKKFSLKDNDKFFFNRVYSEGLEKYANRLKAINFRGKERILDAGCGFGQWSFALSELNDFVDAFDFASNRVNVCKELIKIFNLSNIFFQKASLEDIPYDDNTFDLVFCYSTIFITNPEISFKELFRVLKKGGKLYVNMNDLGWYIHNLENAVNNAKDHSSKQMAIETLENSFNFYSTGKRTNGKQIVMPVNYTLNLMKKIGFTNLIWDGEGLINLNNEKNCDSFFKKTYNGKVGVYEILAEKS